jgi:neutral ceramidase
MRGPGLASLILLFGCGSDDTPPPDNGVSTEHCSYLPVSPTAGAGGTVTAGALTAGAAERVLHIPVGTALGGYTGRANFLSAAGTVDARKITASGSFNPSIGVTAAPRVKALALTAGGETVVLLKADMIFAYEGMVFELEQRLGAEYTGKILLATSHSHSAWAQFTGHGPLKLGAGQLRDLVYKRFLEAFEGAAREALDARRPARLGIFATAAFDPTDQINRQRRTENDMLPNGNRGEDHLYLIRVDGTDGVPIAIAPIFGQHPTLNDQDNPFASTDASGALERALQEQFDAKVVVMQIQSAGGDTSAVGHGGLDCSVKPGSPGDPCFSWTAEEGHGRAAIDELMVAWQQAGTAMRDSLELEMISRSIETGPRPETFSIRDGAMTYKSFDGTSLPDGIVHDGTVLRSPIDEFNAPVGAGLCETGSPMFPAAAIPGTEGILPYGSCIKLDVGGPILSPIFDIDLGADDKKAVCETTRTTISALRIGDYVLGTLPGEVTILLADLVREKSPVAADHTIVVGYAQGHVGYMLRPEDWVLGGYEPSVTFWGPLESEYIAEQLLKLMPLALTAEREDGAAAGTTRVAVPTMGDRPEIDKPALMAGTVPATIPPVTWARTGTPAQAQPPAQIERVSGVATFTWIGDDPQDQTPHVTLQYSPTPSNFAPVRRRSGRVVDDVELVLAYTPSPLLRSGPQTHVWVAEWQAVPWVGAPAADALDARAGVPLGFYRFHVEGDGWVLDSQPSQVVAGGLVASAARAGGMVRATASLHAPKGWRMIDPAVPSNRPVPARVQAVKVELLDMANAPIATLNTTTDAQGVAQIGDNANARSVRITDRFNNVATASLP